MTDEEMAEEYADRTRIVDENTRVGTDCISLVQDYEGNEIDIHERIKQAFLAGLKAGKDMNVSTKWHDLCKNPNDLPPVGIGVIISGYLGDMKGLHGFDEWDGEKWTNTDMPGLVREAWCEIPQYMSEEETCG